MLRFSLMVWAVVPFHDSKPFLTRFALRLIAELSSRICWTTHPASTSTDKSYQPGSG
jgi:hypothetical protein